MLVKGGPGYHCLAENDSNPDNDRNDYDLNRALDDGRHNDNHINTSTVLAHAPVRACLQSIDSACTSQECAVFTLSCNNLENAGVTSLQIIYRVSCRN